MFKRFLKYVEIQTKIASLLPFCLGILFVLYAYDNVNLRNTILFFISMLFFDMTTTALNNYIDARKNGHELTVPRNIALAILLFMLAVACVAGIALAWFTGPVVLICGGACFIVGIFYTFGPASISHMPLGEVFSGVFMGFFIPFLVVFINAPVQSLIYYSIQDWVLQISFNLPGLVKLFVLTIPGIMCIANVMLANNICDLEADRKIDRFTLPHYIGVKNALRLFAANYYIAYFAIIILAIARILPVYSLLILVLLYFVQKNINVFFRRHVKSETFHLSIQNLVAIMIPLIIVVAIASFI